MRCPSCGAPAIEGLNPGEDGCYCPTCHGYTEPQLQCTEPHCEICDAQRKAAAYKSVAELVAQVAALHLECDDAEQRIAELEKERDRYRAQWEGACMARKDAEAERDWAHAKADRYLRAIRSTATRWKEERSDADAVFRRWQWSYEDARTYAYKADRYLRACTKMFWRWREARQIQGSAERAAVAWKARCERYIRACKRMLREVRTLRAMLDAEHSDRERWAEALRWEAKMIGANTPASINQRNALLALAMEMEP